MKKLATLLLAAGMVVASTAPANAVDVKVDARFRTSFATGSNGFAGDNYESVQHRLRLGLTMAASENLSAYTQFQFGGYEWGTTNKHGKADGNGDKITARMLYLDWTVPGTPVKVRMGRHQFGLPAEAFGTNSILGAGYGNREGVVVTAPVADWLGLTAIWARIGSDGGTDLDQNKNTDLFALAANLKFEGVSGAVYAAYAAHDGYEEKEQVVYFDGVPSYYSDKDGKRLTTGGNPAMCYGMPDVEGDAYWLGFTSTFSFFDPFTLKLSAAYGEFNAANKGDDNENGWNVQVKGEYALPFGTAVLGGWYFSGADEDGKGNMPHSGYFAGTNHYFDGFAALNNAHGNTTLYGQWAVQAGIEGVSFLEGLSHDLHVTYMQGTNDKDFETKKNATDTWLTEDDSMVEISLNNVYKVYKNLSARLELAYIINDFDNKGANAGLDEDDWFAGLTFDFKF